MARSQPTTLLAGAIISTALLGAFPVATVQADDDDDDNRSKRSFRVRLDPFQEVPSVSSVARGEFRLRISRDEKTISYELSYSGLEGSVTQGHIHFAQKGVNGGISVWLCQTPPTPPGLTDPTGLSPRCLQQGTVTGELTAANMVPIAAQGLVPPEFAELVKAIRAGRTYANVHSTKFPGGELRAQIK